MKGEDSQTAAGGDAAPVVAALTVRTVGGAPSSSSAGARPSPMEAESEDSTQNKIGQACSSASAAADIPEQRQNEGSQT